MKVDERYFRQSSEQADSIDVLLASDEKVLWKDKPDSKSYIMSSVLKMLPIALIWMVIDIVFIAVISLEMKRGRIPVSFLGFIIPFFIVHLAPVWKWISNIVKAVLELKNIEYAATDRRLILRSGVIGVDFKFLNYSEIESINVKVGLTDKLFKVGDIYINSSSSAAVLYDIDRPYEIGSKLQQIVLDIKADINYPNAMRSEDNPGYRSEHTDNPFV